ncbi:PIN domain-containing protein [Nitrospirillum sp. BR 11828]|uniref:PIN domain-containing protein n=1 Tax=Nitrospirillum sp. BR 11828 TaxID=3104325 RepID=UPI002ACA9728|nr:PIN domain-containing protein [Nitrospirillum sp. BR 11828]MDZ5649043.1 PIN domain-containing protein [Nitrospirillum sp. BR 11828]
MRFTIDTNILVYAADYQAGDRHRKAVDVLSRARGRDCVLTVQALAEFFRTLTGRHKVPAARAAAMVQVWRDALPVVAADDICLVDAMDAVASHNWSFWDAMIWATAKRAGCRLLITEDGQDGRTLGGVTLVNPFAEPPSPLLATALGVAKP